MGLDNQVQPLSYNEINSMYRDISTHQLSTLIEEGIDHLKSVDNTSGESVDILKPLKAVCMFMV